MDSCCGGGMTQKRTFLKTDSDDLLIKLEQRIKARHLQLGGYLHDADEHRKEAKRLLKEGRDLGARQEIKFSLEKQAQYDQEKARYDNLVGLRNTLKNAKQNLSMADLLQRCTAEVKATLEKMPDVVELKREWEDTAERVVATPTTTTTTTETMELPSVPTVTDQQVAEALERLRAPPPPSSVSSGSSVRVPLLSGHG